MTGTIKTLVTDKGFGFITAEGQEKDLFFHSNSLVDVQFSELQQGDAVSFETEMSPKGLNAVNVKRATANAADDAATDEDVA
ncbi:MAG: cold shock domain-containing protein [Patescibacteria group bacterium]